MIKTDLHVHTNFCDGRDTPEEMVLAAVEMGMECLGFSGHSFSPGDEETQYGMTDEVCAEYKKEIRRLAEKYGDRIKILCGMELDYYSENDSAGFDYIIGSVHELRACGSSVVLDYSLEYLKKGIDSLFGGDPLTLAECYYETVADVVKKTDCDIIGHFDLITKFNEIEPLFDTQAARYVKAWQSAADELLKYGIPFEINTGAMARGKRTGPYPAEDMREYIKKRGGRFILSSDCHDKRYLCYKFEEYEDWVK